MQFLKKIIMSSFLIYAFNVMAVSYNIVVPINIWTLSYTACFGFPAIVVLLLIKIIGF